MCGICGTVGVADAPIEAMAATLAHRGPDDRGVERFPDAGVALGFCRLAIIDLSPGGHQPWVSDDGLVTVVFNGELYNFHELREDLRAAGAVFRSESDTEVLVRAFERDGTACFPQMDGMFAAAIFDRRTGAVHL